MTESSTSQAPQLIELTDKALEEVKKLLSEEEPGKGLRLAVQGGGCSGFSYKLSFDTPTEKDHLITLDGVSVMLDPKSAIYLKGITVDFQGGLEGKGFVFMNPNAANTCGCGESFSV